MASVVKGFVQICPSSIFKMWRSSETQEWNIHKAPHNVNTHVHFKIKCYLIVKKKKKKNSKKLKIS